MQSTKRLTLRLPTAVYDNLVKEQKRHGYSTLNAYLVKICSDYEDLRLDFKAHIAQYGDIETFTRSAPVQKTWVKF